MEPRKKTWKREVAILLLLWLVYLSIFGSIEVLSLVVWPVFAFAVGAFGIDEYSKNILGLDSRK